MARTAFKKFIIDYHTSVRSVLIQLRVNAGVLDVCQDAGFFPHLGRPRRRYSPLTRSEQSVQLQGFIILNELRKYRNPKPNNLLLFNQPRTNTLHPASDTTPGRGVWSVLNALDHKVCGEVIYTEYQDVL